MDQQDTQFYQVLDDGEEDLLQFGHVLEPYGQDEAYDQEFSYEQEFEHGYDEQPYAEPLYEDTSYADPSYENA
ncbi:MAG: hypothetical protein GX096_13230, partial [Clostridiales bacterium]|nr:hypothetical protein [Clostridiales bacterium]